MKVILTQNVANLGSLGDEVKVKDGYARNFLLPRGLALAAESTNARTLAHRRRYLERVRAEAVEQARAEAEKVANMELELTAKAGPSGRLFGSITNRDIQTALAEKGFEVDRKAVQLHEPIRQVGTHYASVKLHTDVKTDITIHVKAELTEEEKAQAEAERQAAAESEAEVAAEAEKENAPEVEEAAAGQAQDASPEEETAGA